MMPFRNNMSLFRCWVCREEFQFSIELRRHTSRKHAGATEESDQDQTSKKRARWLTHAEPSFKKPCRDGGRTTSNEDYDGDVSFRSASSSSSSSYANSNGIATRKAALQTSPDQPA